MARTGVADFERDLDLAARSFARKERTWTVFRLAVSGRRDSGRRKQKPRSLSKISITAIKRLAKLAGHRLKRGRPKTTPRVQKKQLNDLIEATSEGFDVFNGNALHFFNHVELEFGLSPRQYLKWVTQHIRRGKYTMRKCLFCGELFPPLSQVKGIANDASLPDITW